MWGFRDVRDINCVYQTQACVKAPGGYNFILFSLFIELYQGLLKSNENFDLLYSHSPLPFLNRRLRSSGGGIQQGQDAGSPDVTKSNLTVKKVPQVCNSTSQFYILCTVLPYSLDPQSDVSPNENKCPYSPQHTCSCTILAFSTARQSLTLNLIPDSLPYKLFACRKQLLMLIPQRCTRLPDSPPHSIKATIMLLFLRDPCRHLDVAAREGGRDGGKERRDMENWGWGGDGEGGRWVFVKQLSGVLRILAERGPLMGDRQAECLAGRRRLVAYRSSNPAINHV